MKSTSRHRKPGALYRHALPLTLLITVLVGTAAGADNDYLYGIHWWGYSPGTSIDTLPATMLDAPTYGGWDLETIITHSDPWWQAPHFVGLYNDLPTSKNVTIITRIDYNWGETVPSPSNPDYPFWPGTVVSTVNTLRQGCHIWLIGNEPNIVGEGNNWPDNQVTPSGYAQIYRDVRNAIHNQASTSPRGPHIVLVAAPSPGVVIPGLRWMDGDQWLGQVLDNIPNDEIDGIAIHAYGGDVAGFRASYSATLATIDSRGLQDRPVYMTEWNRYATPGDPGAEALSASFLQAAFADVNNWNQTPGNHDIVCMCWFVYDADQQAGGGWDGYSIEYWRTHGNPLGNPGNLWTAFEQTVDLRYPAGHAGIYEVEADFSASPLTGRAPLQVQFTDESSGMPTTHAWTFGDGGNSYQQNPSHLYLTKGTYTVTLNISGGNGADSETKTDYITVLPPFSDLDEDGDVDLDDYALFQACFTGIGTPGSEDPICAAARLDEDNDVDATDLNLFRNCLSGANLPLDPACNPS